LYFKNQNLKAEDRLEYILKLSGEHFIFGVFEIKFGFHIWDDLKIRQFIMNFGNFKDGLEANKQVSILEWKQKISTHTQKLSLIKIYFYFSCFFNMFID
jgi:hypothetical protein